MTLGVYSPGDSFLHRSRAGGKLAALACVAVLASVINVPWLLALGFAVCIFVWRLSGLDLSYLLATLKPLAWFLVPIAVFQWWAIDIHAAMRTLLAILIIVTTAASVSLTTRPTEMLNVLHRGLAPLARFGVDPDAVAFSITYLVRLVPVVKEVGAQTREAIVARGSGRNPVQFAGPFTVRLLRQSDAMAEALDARGFGDR